MKLRISGSDYDRVRALEFAPEADLSGRTLPINGFTAEVIAAGSAIEPGAVAALYDDGGNLWARYYVTHAVRVEGGAVRLRAQSPLILIDRDVLPATMYQATPVADVLSDVFRNTASGLGARVYALHADLSGAVITGFAPRQTARERLLWTCVAIGAWVRGAFSELIEILPVDDAAAEIPISRTYWRPQARQTDCVTALRARAYSFAAGVPTATDRWVQDDGGACYLVSSREVVLANPDAPAGAPENVVSLEGLYFLNDANVSSALTRLARWLFNRGEAALEVVDNGEYVPGQRVRVHLDEATLATGFIRRAAFDFGAQARAALTLTGLDVVASAPLTILYRFEGTQVGRADYRFPVGGAYSVENPYIDLTMNGRRYVFRPLNAVAAGVVEAGGTVDEQSVAVALELRRGVLHVVSVDEVTENARQIGVIA